MAWSTQRNIAFVARRVVRLNRSSVALPVFGWAKGGSWEGEKPWERRYSVALVVVDEGKLINGAPSSWVMPINIFNGRRRLGEGRESDSSDVVRYVPSTTKYLADVREVSVDAGTARRQST